MALIFSGFRDLQVPMPGVSDLRYGRSCDTCPSSDGRLRLTLGVSRLTSPDAWCLGSPIRMIVRHVSFFRRTAQINSRGFETYDVLFLLTLGTPISRMAICRLAPDFRHLSLRWTVPIIDASADVTCGLTRVNFCHVSP
jgi:hypothetical protein